MTRAEMKAHGVTLCGALALIVLILGAQGLADKIDRDADARIDYQRWIAGARTPGAQQTAVAVHDGQRISCTIYSRATFGMTREVVSVAVMDVAQ